MIDRILLGRNSKGLEQLKWMEPKQIAEVIRLEHPQIISIVMSFLDPDQAFYGKLATRVMAGVYI